MAQSKSAGCRFGENYPEVPLRRSLSLANQPTGSPCRQLNFSHLTHPHLPKEKCIEGMPSATIDEAETAFVRRKFVRSLRLANSILENGGSGSDEPACAGRAAASGEGQREHQVHHHAIAETSGEAVNVDHVIHCISALVPGYSLDALQKAVASSPRSATDPPTDGTCTAATSSSWRVRLTNESNVYDGAAAIVIQSIYEMDSADGQIGGGDNGSAVDDLGRNKHMISDLATLHRYYRKMTMPLGLACIYIQFCSAIGWREDALSFAMDILGHIFELDAPIQEELLLEDWFLDACEELIDLVLTELLPRVEKADDCKALLHRLLGQKEAASSFHKLQNIAISNEVQPSSVDVLVRNLTGTENSLLSSFHPCLGSIFEQCGENLSQMQAELSGSDESLNEESGGVGVTLAADKVSARSAAAATRTSDECDQEDQNAGASQSLSELFQSNIVEPLWESEDRWTNRAAVVAVGVSSLMLWRRRKRIGAAVRSTGHAATAPFREILEAISHPQGPKG